MDFLVQYIIPYIIIYKYLAIFMVSFLAALILPIPSGSILMTAAAFASIGYFDMTLVVVISIVANLLGDNIGYFISRKLGYKVFSTFGFRSILQSNKFKIIEQKFKKRPGFIIFISRFEVVSTLAVNILSGMSNVNYRKYLIHEISGTILQVSIYSSVGYLFGYNLQFITSLMSKLFLTIVLVLFLVLVIFWKKITKTVRK